MGGGGVGQFVTENSKRRGGQTTLLWLDNLYNRMFDWPDDGILLQWAFNPLDRWVSINDFTASGGQLFLGIMQRLANDILFQIVSTKVLMECAPTYP